MKVLLSAFACSPNMGSECGVGWHWARILATHHDVTLLTHACFQAEIEAELAERPIPRLKVSYFEAKPWIGQFDRRHLDSQPYYTWWQWKLLPLARALHQREKFDVTHHITWGTIRYPSWLGLLDTRHIIGPLGGGERAPQRFFAGLPLKQRAWEVLRDIVLYSFKVDPITQFALSRADRIFCKTEDTARFLPRHLARKAEVMMEIGAPPVKPRPQGTPRRPRTQFLFAGRLLPFKGLHLAVDAIAEAVRRGADVGLLAVGDGPLRDVVLAKAARHNLGDRFELRARIPQPELMALYHQADAFLFPSLHDSSGNVVLESLSRGLPVICLDLGGPPCFVHEGCGNVVQSTDLSQAGLVSALADAIIRFHHTGDPERRAMSDAACERAGSLTWDGQVTSLYERLTW